MSSGVGCVSETVGPLFQQPTSEVLFHEHWWLSAATGGRFQEVKVSRGGQVVGRLPFVIMNKMGLTSVRMPAFTHVAGPAVDVGNGKPQSRLLRRLSIVRDLIDQLPQFDSCKLAFEHSTVDGLAFQDCGYKVTPQYTFRIDCRRDLREIWQDMHFKTRQHIRRAQEKFAIGSVDHPDLFTQFYEANLKKKGDSNSLDFASFGALLRECKARSSGDIICATWPNGSPTAMVFLVWGHGTMYYLLSTRAADSADSGSISLLIWKAIERAHSLGLVLDLDGVSSKGTAQFLGGFGGQMHVRLVARRSRPFFSALSYMRGKLFGVHESEAFT